MKLLPDTHSFIRFFEGDTRLPRTARDLIEDENNHLFISIAGIWEMAIKVGLGKLTLAKPFENVITEYVLENEIEVLNISIAHTFAVAKMPLRHRDPFDRLIISQSLVEGIAIVSGDHKFDQYGVTRLWL